MCTLFVMFCIAHSVAFSEDDAKWPEPDKDGRQELEIVMGNEHISFTVCSFVSCFLVANALNCRHPS